MHECHQSFPYLDLQPLIPDPSHIDDTSWADSFEGRLVPTMLVAAHTDEIALTKSNWLHISLKIVCLDRALTRGHNSLPNVLMHLFNLPSSTCISRLSYIKNG